MIVIADGDNNAGSFAPKEAARLARATGTRIYVIGVGSKQPSIPILEDGSVRYRDDLTMDEAVALITARAESTGGAKKTSARKAAPVGAPARAITAADSRAAEARKWIGSPQR